MFSFLPTLLLPPLNPNRLRPTLSVVEQLGVETTGHSSGQMDLVEGAEKHPNPEPSC